MGKDIKEYRIEGRPNGETYIVFWKDMHIGFANKKFDGTWWWATRLPGRKGGRKGHEDVVDCLAAGAKLPKKMVRTLLEAV